MILRLLQACLSPLSSVAKCTGRALSRHYAARTGPKARQCRSVPAFFEARFTRLMRARARAFLSNEEHALFFRPLLWCFRGDHTRWHTRGEAA